MNAHRPCIFLLFQLTIGVSLSVAQTSDDSAPPVPTNNPTINNPANPLDRPPPELPGPASTSATPLSSLAIRRIKFGTATISISGSEFTIEVGDFKYSSTCRQTKTEIYLVLNPFTEKYPVELENRDEFLKLFVLPHSGTKQPGPKQDVDEDPSHACIGVNLKLDQLQRFKFFGRTASTLGFLFRSNTIQNTPGPNNVAPAELVLVDTKTNQHAQIALQNGFMPLWVDNKTFPPSYAEVAWSQLLVNLKPYARAIRPVTAFAWNGQAYDEDLTLSAKIFRTRLNSISLSLDDFEALSRIVAQIIGADESTNLTGTHNELEDSAAFSEEKTITLLTDYVYYSAKLGQTAELSYLFSFVPQLLRTPLRTLASNNLLSSDPMSTTAKPFLRVTREEAQELLRKHLNAECPEKKKEVFQYASELCALKTEQTSGGRTDSSGQTEGGSAKDLALSNVTELGCSAQVQMLATLLAREGLKEESKTSATSWSKPRFVSLREASRAACRVRFSWLAH